MTTTRENLAAALDLLAESLMKPAFTAKDFSERQREFTSRTEQQMTEPQPLAGNALQRLTDAFPAGHVRHTKTLPEQLAAEKAVTLEDRRKALNDVFHDYWEDYLQHNPEFASTIGDNRYNDKVSDYSVKAVNDGLERGLNFLMRLSAIDPAGLSDQEQLSRDLLLRRIVDDQEAAGYMEWEMPVNQMDGIYNEYPQLVTQLSFKTAKDYDDWIARLHAIPHAFSQVTENMSIGMEDKRTPPRYLIEKVLEQVQAIAAQKPEDSPFALPLKSFPAGVPEADRQRIRTEMIDAIQKEVVVTGLGRHPSDNCKLDLRKALN